ncbi:MAG: WYL domain-containing protein [Clostridia bacterium]|nr:WYL domain-containing protein [Clostridia bacterium]
MENTDASHGLTIPEIAKKMEAYDFTPERKSLYTDLDALGAYGFAIESDGKRPPRYHYVRNPEKDLTLNELKLISDAVRSSKFMSSAMSNKIVNKLKGQLSEHDRLALERQITVPNRVKRTTFALQDNLDRITQAIESNLQIKFKYAYYDEKKKKRYRKKADTDGFYFVSPYKLIYSDDNYFLLAYDNSDRKPKMKHFRVDKMDALSVVVAEREGQEAYAAITDIDNYTNYTFSMHGGDVRHVTLVFINHITDTILDRFGSDVVVSYHDETHSKTVVSAALSDAFYAWVFSLGKRIKIVAPQEAVDGMKKLLEDVSSRYM